VHHHPLLDAAGAHDRHLRRHDDQIGKGSADHAEIRQRDGRATQLLGRDRPRLGVGPHPIEPRAQVPQVALADVAHYGHDQLALGVEANVAYWQILLQNDFGRLSEQH